jgi:cation-transporting ATPase 13A3/4/5
MHLFYIKIIVYIRSFIPIRFNTSKPLNFFKNILKTGVNKLPDKDLREMSGENSIEVPILPIYKLLVDEGLHPFIVFQIASVIIWMLEDYYYYAVLIFGITVFSVVITIYETRMNMKNLQKMTQFDCKVKLKQKGKSLKLTIYFFICFVLVSQVVSSKFLMPGDVIEIRSGTTLPCDALLLTGFVLIFYSYF